MQIKDYFWECPRCHSKVDVLNQLVRDCFDYETGEAEFAVEEDCGLWYEAIFCPECRAEWALSTSGILNDKDGNTTDNRELCIAELIEAFAKNEDDCKRIREIVDGRW